MRPDKPYQIIAVFGVAVLFVGWGMEQWNNPSIPALTAVNEVICQILSTLALLSIIYTPAAAIAPPKKTSSGTTSFFNIVS